MSKSKYWIEREQRLARSFFDSSAVKDLYLVSVSFSNYDKNLVYYTNDFHMCGGVRYESVTINLVKRSDIPGLIKRYSRVAYPAKETIDLPF